MMQVGTLRENGSSCQAGRAEGLFLSIIREDDTKHQRHGCLCVTEDFEFLHMQHGAVGLERRADMLLM